MNAIVRLKMVLLFGGLMRAGFRWFVAGSSAPGAPSAAPGFAQTQIAPLVAQVLGVQITPAQAGGLAAATLIYAFLVGYLARVAFGEHVFGSRLNGVIALMGAWGALALFGLLIGRGSPDQWQGAAVCALTGSAAALAAAAALKAFVAGEFDTFMRGGQTRVGATMRRVSPPTPRFELSSRGPSADRLRAAVSRAPRCGGAG